MTKKLEELKVSMTSGMFSWGKKYLPIVLAGGLSGFATTQTNASLDNSSIDSCKANMILMDKKLSEQIVKTDNLDARFTELKQDLREVRGDTREILVILTGKNDYNRSFTNRTQTED